MRHKVRSRTLGRQTGHRISMLRNLATSLLKHKKITTTVTRAREVSRFTENLISLARKAKLSTDDAERLAFKRRVFSDISDRAVAQDLFENVATFFCDRHAEAEAKCGGYTRVFHVGNRKGDGAPMAVIALVD